MSKPTRKSAKVVPLKTVQQLKVDLDLLTTERDLARADLLSATLEKDQIKAAVEAERAGIAQLLTEIRNLATEVEEIGPMPLSVRLKVIFFPSFMMKLAIRKTQATVWAKIISRLNEHQYRKHERVAMARTIRVEKIEDDGK